MPRMAALSVHCDRLQLSVEQQIRPTFPGRLPAQRQVRSCFLPPEAILTQSIVRRCRIRELEVIANNAFDAYRELYYGSTDGSIGVSSVYFWDLDDNQFAMCALIKKSMCLSSATHVTPARMASFPNECRTPFSQWPRQTLRQTPGRLSWSKTMLAPSAMTCCVSRFGSGQCDEGVLCMGLDPCGGGCRGRRGKDSQGQ